MKVVSYAGVTFSFNSRMMAKKSWFGWPSKAQRLDMVRRGDTKEGSNQRGERGGECNSIVFYLSFLTHSACQNDVTYIVTGKSLGSLVQISKGYDSYLHVQINRVRLLALCTVFFPLFGLFF